MALPDESAHMNVAIFYDACAVLYTIVVAAGTAVVFGLFPALQVSRGNLHETLKEGTRGNTVTKSFLRSTLVVAQIAFALVALVGALLFVRTFLNLGAFNVGFDVRPLMSMRFYMSGAPYEQTDAKLRRVEDIVRRVEALPAVRATSASNFVPLAGGGGGGTVIIDGRPAQKGQEVGISVLGVTPHFNATMGLAILEGRDFTDAEGWSRSPVAIINHTMRTRFWPDRSAIGQRFRLEGEKEDWYTVIGVTPDINLYGVDPGNEQARRWLTCHSRISSFSIPDSPYGSMDISSVTSAVREAIRSSDPNLPMAQVRTVAELRRLSFWQDGLYGWIFGTTGIVGLLLAAIGVYGVLLYSVSQRAQEIGVRLALGARNPQILRLVVGQGLLLAAIGILTGALLAGLAMPAARSLLFKVSPFDPLTFLGVAGFLAAVALLASYLPRAAPCVSTRSSR